MIMSSAKHQVVALVIKNVHLGEEVVVAPQEQEQELVGSETSVLIIDAMCVVNMVTKTPDLTQGAHFAEKFVEIIATMSTGYDGIRVTFDQYLPGSLKQRTLAKRTSKTTAVHYHVNDDTKTGNLKMFLSHINTKSELTKYGAHFAEKFVEIIATMSTGYDGIRVAFDQYLPGSLKERTRAQRTSKTTAVHYHVNDDTKTGNLKMFLPHINTKSELTKYLSQKLLNTTVEVPRGYWLCTKE